MFFHRPSMTSTCDSAESVATPPPEPDLDDEQLRDMLASPLYLQEREASVDRSRVCQSYREKTVSSSSHFRASVGSLAAVFSNNGKSSQESTSDRDGISLAHRPVRGEMKLYPENGPRPALEEQRDHLLAEAKSEELNEARMQSRFSRTSKTNSFQSYGD